MALSKNIIFKGLTINSAYLKIDSLSGNKNSMDINLGVYANKDSNESLEQRFYNFAPSVADTAPNTFKQGYEYLKTLDEYKDAVDLLDEEQIH